ncbi:GNAT family N-acetyltransferase [Roseateles violae]|uniref:GNAT family N-acetyltransferase n=1 Tax=Roseateles violae TaxID=3058042 RepID=A0ABT8DXJ4_9BURK|nr:GNAT family N-acetyltransferase [Pelomonas sp. PFR6]MDN3921376.1 GNAT family N-acetyltransferase [Pelomonas sp. PFR6]
MSPALAAHLAGAIDTPRLLLEPLTGAHAAAFFPLLQEDALYEWISMTKPDSLGDLTEAWRRSEQRVSPDGLFAWLAWAVRRRSDGRIIGRVDAEIDAKPEATNLGYYFFSPFWGQGHASEAVAAASEQLIARGVRRLVATVTVGNLASARVLRKAGFEFTRILPANDVVRGRAVDDEEYVRLAPLRY